MFKSVDKNDSIQFASFNKGLVDLFIIHFFILLFQTKLGTSATKKRLSIQVFSLKLSEYLRSINKTTEFKYKSYQSPEY